MFLKCIKFLQGRVWAIAGMDVNQAVKIVAKPVRPVAVTVPTLRGRMGKIF
jgi:hypothetical protein